MKVRPRPADNALDVPVSGAAYESLTPLQQAIVRVLVPILVADILEEAAAERDAARDQEQWDEERARADKIPRDVPLCTICWEVAVPETGDVCAECKATWSGR